MGIEPTAEAWELSEMAIYAPLSVRTNMSTDILLPLRAGPVSVHFLRLDLIFREPYLAEAVTSLNVPIEGHHYSCGPQVTAYSNQCPSTRFARG